MSRNEGDWIKLVIVLGMAGGTWLYYGYRKFCMRRIAEDLPTSPIRTASQGLVEFQGNAYPLVAPKWIGLSGQPVAYSQIEGQFLSGGKRRNWTTAFTCTLGERFIVRDQTGAAHVLTKGADFELNETITSWDDLTGAQLSAIYDHIYPIAKKTGFLFQQEPGNGTWRVVEKTIHTGESVYVVGVFKTRSIEKPYRIINEKNLETEVQPAGGVMKSAEHPFIIADCKQHELLNRTNYGFIQMIGAAALLAGAAWVAFLGFTQHFS